VEVPGIEGGLGGLAGRRGETSPKLENLDEGDAG
jgi:hypothetical protein